jgi:hypothetical protein
MRELVGTMYATTPAILESNVEYLRTLPRSAGERRAKHQQAGLITLQQMVHEWAMHDPGAPPP